MYTITKYICEYDGKEFDDEDECERHEFDLRYQDILKNKEIQMFDSDLKPTESAEYTTYFRCLTEEAARYFVELNEYKGMAYYPLVKDIRLGEAYYFDEDGEKYVSFEQLAKPVRDMTKLFNFKLEE